MEGGRGLSGFPDPSTLPEGRIDPARVDATTEAEISAQEREDEEEATGHGAIGPVGLSQTELARRIDVPHETIRNWEQGKRCPTGAARALLRSTRHGNRAVKRQECSRCYRDRDDQRRKNFVMS